uniref:CDP-alcohol phosphatidyltransferase n=1 Tax=Globisporangium ultimum (strain ATCC 200006 / CBS 805.95 / DAOM BR144) TaxID=431595 RepID=K3WKS5_GLOUD
MANGTAAAAALKSAGGKIDNQITHRVNSSGFAASRASSPSGSEDESANQSTTIRILEKKDVAAKSMDSLLERYYSATSTKMYDVEELIDYYFHRRLAAFSAVIISYLPFVITPNQITIFGLGLGWASAVCLYDSEFHTPLGWEPNQSLAMASLLMFAWIVSDCADGQVARLCKRGTRTGRILDGFVDGLVLAPNCAILGLMCAHRYGEPQYALYSVIAGLSLWVHALVYDKVKNVYMENALPQSECDGETVESVRAEYHAAKAQNPFALDSILLGIYVIYLSAQAMFTSDAASKAEAARHTLLATCSDEYHTMFIRRYQNLVRLASFMGISAHVVGLYVAYFTAIFYWDALFYVQVYFAVVLNVILVVVLFLYFKTGMATAQPNKQGSL